MYYIKFESNNISLPSKITDLNEFSLLKIVS